MVELKAQWFHSHIVTAHSQIKLSDTPFCRQGKCEARAARLVTRPNGSMDIRLCVGGAAVHATRGGPSIRRSTRGFLGYKPN
jgi:hypothetical protein